MGDSLCTWVCTGVGGAKEILRDDFYPLDFYLPRVRE